MACLLPMRWCRLLPLLIFLPSRLFKTNFAPPTDVIAVDVKDGDGQWLHVPKLKPWVPSNSPRKRQGLSSWREERDELRSVEFTSWCFAKSELNWHWNIPVDVLSVLIGSSKLTPAELSTRRLHSRVDKWRHRGGMSCACPGRLEVSRGIVEAKHVTSGRHPSSVVDLTNTNSCQLKSTHVTPTNCSRITSPSLVCVLSISGGRISDSFNCEWMMPHLSILEDHSACQDYLFCILVCCRPFVS